jgi:hypothetical protein
MTAIPELTKELTYTVIVENQDDQTFLATVWNLPDCQAMGNTREEAINQVQQKVTEKLARSEIVTITISDPKPEHPWTKFAGMFKDDPLFDQVREFMETERQREYQIAMELDNELIEVGV